MKYLYIRDDDVIRCDESFSRIFAFLKKNAIPAIYGVIPKFADENLAAFLNEQKKINPHLIEITQHGWSHENHSKDKISPYEFGPRRSYAEQKHDISEGLKKMKHLFGNKFSPAFLPPWHDYDRHTLSVLKELGFRILSSSKKTKMKNKDIFYFPSGICFHRETPKKALSEVNSFLKRNRHVEGVIIHHYDIKNDEDFRKTTEFLLYLKILEKEKKIKITLFSTLISAASGFES